MTNILVITKNSDIKLANLTFDTKVIPNFTANDIIRFFKKARSKYRHVFYLNTELDSPFKTQAFHSFVTSCVKASPQAQFFVRRPNEYTSVQTFDFLYLPFNSRLEDLKTSLKSYYHSMPEMMKPVVRFTFNTSKSIIALLKSDNSKSVSTAGSSSPEPVLPSILSNFSKAQFSSWEPELSTKLELLSDVADTEFSHPLAFHVILLNKCNLTCVMCPYHSPVYKEHHTSDYLKDLKMMSFEVFEKLAKYAGEKKISLQLGQIEEAMMHKELFRFIRTAKEYGVPHIHLTTNGTLLTKDKAKLLAESGINSVMFSIDASDKDTYKRIRGKDLEDLEEKITYFLSIAKDKKINTMASFILQDQPSHERDNFLKKWQERGISQVTYYVLTDHDKKTGQFIRKEENYQKGKRYPCASPWMQSVIFPDGEVSLCCKTMTDVGWKGVVNVGSIADKEFSEIWNGHSYKELRKELISNHFKQFSSCADCQIWSAHSYVTETTPTYVKTYNETMSTYTLK